MSAREGQNSYSRRISGLRGKAELSRIRRIKHLCAWIEDYLSYVCTYRSKECAGGRRILFMTRGTIFIEIKGKAVGRNYVATVGSQPMP